MPDLLEGALSVAAALEAKQRDIHEILIDREKRYDQRFARLERQARDQGVSVAHVSREHIEGLCSGKSHGGLAAHVGERRFARLTDLLPQRGAAFIAMLDGVEDPHNFGFALRALYAAGVDGVVLPPRNWLHASAIVGRASAGASERLRLAVVDSAAHAADRLRASGLRVAATGRTRAGVDIYQADLTQPLFLLIGGEKRGITRSFLAAADIALEIPYGRGFAASLGTVSAASIIGFEVLRQRRMGG